MVLRILTDILLPVFFVLALGFYAGKRRRVDNRDTASINVLLMHFALPCSLFLGIARTSLPLLRSQVPLLAVVAVAMGLTYALQFYLNRRFFHVPLPESAVGSLTSSFANNVAVGIPLLVSLYGPPGLTAVAVGIVVGALLLSPLTLVILESQQEASHATQWPKRFAAACLASVRRPVVVAPIAAMLFLFVGLKLPIFLTNSLDLIGKTTVGLALFLTGLLLSSQPFRFSMAVFTGVLNKNFLQPAIAAALIILFRLPTDLGREAFMLAVLPAGFFGTVFGARYGLNSVDINSILVLSTVVSIVTIPIAYGLSLLLP